MTAWRTATRRPRPGRHQQGFTLLEVLISMFVLTVGLVAMLGVFATAMASTQTAQQDMIAKQLAQQAMETIYTARETANLTWNQIQNVGGPGTPGIFRTGLQAIKQPGTDGIFGTINDGGSSPQTMSLPGPDGIMNTSDDQIMGLTNYQRSIAITNTAAADLRTITVTIRYNTAQNKFPKQYVLSGLISSYR